ncbi:MAG TPA: hypothetical protein VFJ91_06245 [Gaiellaceae bacterium]|nr:hypothetical protein [Gaiellaceae bacterium]
MTELETTLREALAREPSVVRAFWDAEEPRLTVALDDVGRRAEDYLRTTQRVSQLVMPALGPARASLACGPEYGVMPTVRGVAIYEREPS